MLAAAVWAYPRLLWLLSAVVSAALTLCWTRRCARGPARAARGALAALAAISLLGGALRFAAPKAPVAFFDEIEHLDAARNLADDGVWGETAVGGAPGWSVYAPTYWPGLHQATLAAAFKAFGGTERVAYGCVGLLSALTIPLAFGLAWAMTGSAPAALGAALLLALSPLHRHLSASADMGAPSLFWGAAALFLFWTWLEDSGACSPAPFTLALVLAMQSRPEGFLYLVPVAAAWRIGRARLPRPSAGQLLAWSVSFAAVAVIQRHSALTSPAALHRSLAVLAASAPRTLLRDAWICAGWPQLALFSPLAAFGAWEEWRAERASAAALLALVAAYPLFFSLLALGDFSSDIYVKYSLPAHFAALILAAFGAASLRPRALAPAALAAGAAVWLLLPPSLPTQYDAARRGLAASLRRAGEAVPPGDYVIALSAPAVRRIAGRPAVSAGYYLENAAEADAKLAGRGLWLMEDAWFRADIPRAARLASALAPRYVSSAPVAFGDSILAPDVALLRLTQRRDGILR